ncbi:MAG: tyrosine-protein phosphatase [Gemmatales bacterium]|nr:tyrosine-protein phosphatase [Gemmatales bacterium]MDW8385635.1 tyrosine-protein phosphatase [Gemmatales bacterium]
MARILPYTIGLVFLIAGVAVPYAYHTHREQEYRNFRVVKPGYLYRSGQLTPTGLKRIIEEYGIRTVINLREENRDQGDASSNRWEEELCSKENVAFVRIPARSWWSKDGPPPARRSVARFLEVFRNPDKYPPPILLHCFAGEHRTGAYCAIYRMEFEGWSPAEAIAEMKRCGYVNLDQEWDVRTFLELYRPSQSHSVADSSSRH